MQEKNTIRLNSLELQITNMEVKGNGAGYKIAVDCGHYGVHMVLVNAVQTFSEAGREVNTSSVTEHDEITFQYDDVHDVTVGKDWITVGAEKRKWSMQTTFYKPKECVSEVEFMIHMMDLHPTVSD